MNNPNNCATCEWKKNNPGNVGWCYMFKNEPTMVCQKHTAKNMNYLKNLKPWNS